MAKMQQCGAFAQTTSAQCKNRAVPGTSYCLVHLGKTSLVISGLIGALFGLAVGEVWRAIVPSSELQEIRAEATGGDTYAYFMAVPDMGEGDPPTYPLTLWVKGKYPMRGVDAAIQTVYDDPAKKFQSIREIPLPDRTLLPGIRLIYNNFRVPIGRHIITIWSRRGLLNQKLVLSMSNGDLQQTGDVFRDGKKLHEIGKPY